MLPTKEFVDQVEDAYGRLYDLAYLRTHPLVGLLIRDSSLSPKEKAWQLHHLLLEVISELKPAPQMPMASRAWRRHQLLVLRYIRAVDVDAVAAELGISIRHYYREHRTAIEGLAASLWSRLAAAPAGSGEVHSPAADQASLSQMELLRLEAARVAQPRRFASVGTVLEGALAVLCKMIEQRHVDVRIQVPEDLPSVSVDESLLRQLVLSVVEYMIEPARRATLRLGARIDGAVLCLTARTELDPSAPPSAFPVEEKASGIRDLAALSGVELRLARRGKLVFACDLLLPVTERTVLVVDDNDDVLELFRRYLTFHHYAIVTARTAQEAFTLACHHKPYAITLDLMMRGQDGWDLLQTLLMQPDTRHIPVIVCTVLKQKALALSLGASAFLEKPISEEALVAALDALQ